MSENLNKNLNHMLSKRIISNSKVYDEIIKIEESFNDYVTNVVKKMFPNNNYNEEQFKLLNLLMITLMMNGIKFTYDNTYNDIQNRDNTKYNNYLELYSILIKNKFPDIWDKIKDKYDSENKRIVNLAVNILPAKRTVTYYNFETNAEYDKARNRLNNEYLEDRISKKTYIKILNSIKDRAINLNII